MGPPQNLGAVAASRDEQDSVPEKTEVSNWRLTSAHKPSGPFLMSVGSVDTMMRIGEEARDARAQQQGGQDGSIQRRNDASQTLLGQSAGCSGELLAPGGGASALLTLSVLARIMKLLRHAVKARDLSMPAITAAPALPASVPPGQVMQFARLVSQHFDAIFP